MDKRWIIWIALFVSLFYWKRNEITKLYKKYTQNKLHDELHDSVEAGKILFPDRIYIIPNYMQGRMGSESFILNGPIGRNLDLIERRMDDENKKKP